MSQREPMSGAVAAVIVVLSLAAYFLAFAEPLSPELTAMPRWYRALEPTPETGEAGERMAFSAGDRYGYFSPDGSVFIMADAPGGASLSDAAYVVPVAGGGTVPLRSADGAVLAELGAGEPFFSGGRLYSAAADGSAVAAYDASGARSWSYSFPSVVSAFCSVPDLVVAGTVDGWMEGIGPSGEALFSFAPGGSRLSVILGVAASADGEWVAAVSGIDPQRLVVLGRGRDEYRVVSHRYLDSDYREPVSVAILDRWGLAMYRRPDGIGVRALDGSVDALLPVKADSFEVTPDEGRGIAYFIARRAGGSEIVAFSPPARVLGRVPLPPDASYVRFSGGSVFLGAPGWLARFDFTEG